MPRLSRLLPALLLLLTLVAPRALAFGFPGSNDNMFPPAPAAKSSINFDGRGFLIHGKRTFIVAGDFHYSRMPRALWRDRLLRIKRAGYNTVQTYTFWNFHETREGHFDFSGDKDLNAYLQLIHQLGMYAIVRVGPYVNAEWDSGGWPVWLRFKPGLVVRDDNRPFLFYLDRWLAHLMPIVAANQINRGGAVILVQLENEDTRGAGTDLPNPYFQHLKDKCVALGLQVPFFFSGVNHGDNPASDAPFDTSARTSPWFTSEFWTGWIRFYGEDSGRTQARVRATWNVIANGGAGYTHYTVAGGSDFDTWACDQQGASYDFGAPIGQAGDLRTMFYGFKRANLFATSFPQILADAKDATGQYQGTATAPQLGVVARTSPAGTAVFLKNDGDAPVKTQVKDRAGKLFPTAGPMTVAPHETLPFVEGYPLAPGVTLDMTAAHVLGVQHQDRVTTLVIYGAPGDPAEVRFHYGPAFISPFITFKDGVPTIVSLPYGDQTAIGPHTLRVLAVSSDLADRTFFVRLPDNRQAVVCGPDYVGEVREQGGRLIFDTEQSAADVGKPLRAWLVPGDGPMQPLTVRAGAHVSPRPPTLTHWQMASGVIEAQPGYTDVSWKKSDAPLPMGADDDPSAYAWYRTVVTAPKAGAYSMNFSDVGDWVSVFVNGAHAGSSPVRQRFRDPVTASVPVTLKAGANTVALLTAHYGREKLHAYIGPVDTLDAKGVSGPVALGTSGGASVTLTHWRWKMDDRGEASAGEQAAPGLDTTGNGWQDAASGQDVFGGHVGFAWLRTTLDAVPGKARIVHFSGVDDNATVYLNGQRLFHQQGYGTPFDVPLDSAWKDGGPNVLAVLVENTGGPGSLSQEVDLNSSPDGGAPSITGWKMRGGVQVPAESGPDWRSLAANAPAPGVPTFYQAHFTLTAPAAVGPHPVFRVSPAGLSRGFVWFNGHNLGRFPERSPVDGFYLPECWLRPGSNSLVVFDEDGQPPTQVHFTEETIAGRVGVELTTAPAAHPPRRTRRAE